jgi:nicotinate phosphoribosyltransferase
MISPLLTDLYQLTMAYGYWQLQLHEREAVFHLTYRQQPFDSYYAVACGLGSVIDFCQNWHFSRDDISYLASLTTPTGDALFVQEFLDYLANLQFSCDIAAIAEGTVVFPNEPLIRIKGPLLQAQLLESSLLNIVNFQTLIATKAARMAQAAAGDAVLEFGMRRAQGPNGALAASRAAYIGGCSATSHVLAGKEYNIPVAGTHAHSWVNVFDSELAAFAAYAKMMPDNCILLVDTYNTLTGIQNALRIGEQLRLQGKDLVGVRLDSGDLLTLSQQARLMLDTAGFTNTKIIASNNLDEYRITELKQQGAPITVWGIGTNLVTAYDHAALDGVYKLSALRDAQGMWQYKLKLSEQAVKISTPGIHQIRRCYQDGVPYEDIVYDLELGLTPKINCKDNKDLLQDIFTSGELVYQQPSIHASRQFALEQVKLFSQSTAVTYPVTLEENLKTLREKLIIQLRQGNHA